jgi:hypothetical protein
VYTAQGSSGGLLIVAAGDGAGDFAAPVLTDLPGNINLGNIDSGGAVLQLADADGDDTIDLIGLGGSDIHFFSGDGSGGFAAPVSSNGGFPANPDTGGEANLGIGDATGDGVTDLILVGYEGDLQVAVGSGGGSFGQAKVVRSYALEGIEGRAFGDVDGNGTMDFVAAHAPSTEVLVSAILINP